MVLHDELVTIRIEDGEVAADESWVYVWVHCENDRRVIYVGATGMHPETRAWLHLHHDDPEVGRVLERYPDAATEPLQVFAVRVPAGISRQSVRAAVTARLDDDDLLSRNYVGDTPPTGEIDVAPEVARVLDRIISAVTQHVGATPN